MSIRLLKDIDSLQRWRAEGRGAQIVLVPTMGALHEGHCELIRMAREHGDRVLVSIFVNPLQFNVATDLENYPRRLDGDLKAAARAGADAVFAPTVESLYPPGDESRVNVGPLADPLCGQNRPGHFEGVCTIVVKLFMLSGCAAAVFGEKDFQQLAIVRRVVEDLHLPLEIIAHPTVRDPDGLAMSSRNLRLSEEARKEALSIPRALRAAEAAWDEGERQRQRLEAIFRERLSSALNLDYGELRLPSSLARSGEVLTGDQLFAVAAEIDGVRLIDNLLLRDPSSRR
ncbi:MAG: pantoate--beta-alanine ligase [Myxococcota bacterium]|nr:pantoate--beta-alanine ligase [Myxococcota bacterium]